MFWLDWVVSSVPRGQQRLALRASATNVLHRTRPVHREFPSVLHRPAADPARVPGAFPRVNRRPNAVAVRYMLTE